MNVVAECIPETCGDSCGDISDGCGATLSCGTCSSWEICVSGECEDDEDDDDDSSSSSTTGAVVDTVDHTKSSCVSAWSCGTWTECVGGTQTRECTDIYNCVAGTDKPSVTQSCDNGDAEVVAEVVEETCSDEIKNQDERGIDCGGVCEERCGFFTMMGNAVNVPLNSSKQFIEENKVLTFSSLGVVVLIVSWLIVAKFVLKKGAFFFLKDIKFFKRNEKNNS